LSDLYNLLGNDARVVEIAQTLMQLDPTSFEHPLSAAQALQRLGQGEAALNYANQALALAPVDAQEAITELIQSLNGSDG
jgi:tetratricopeptide (TPR) repeat protein